MVAISAPQAQVWASEHGGGGEGEGEAEGGHEGGGSGKGADREWAKRTSKLNIQETKIKDLTHLLQKLIQEKNQKHEVAGEKGHTPQTLEQISTSYKQLTDIIKTYNADRAELKYRFPEEGALIERRYVPLREQSLEQIEKEIGLNGELTRTKKKIDKKYATFIDDGVKPIPQKKKFEVESTLREKPKPGEESQRLKLSQ